MTWGDLPWLSRSEAGGGIVQLAERLLEASLDTSNPTAFLNRRLPEITTEFSAQWCSVYKRAPQWTRVAETGRRGFDEIPHRLLDQVLDRDAGAFHGDAVARWLAVSGRSAGDRTLGHGRCVADGGSQSFRRIVAGRGGGWPRAGRLSGSGGTLGQKRAANRAVGQHARSGDSVFSHARGATFARAGRDGRHANSGLRAGQHLPLGSLSPRVGGAAGARHERPRLRLPDTSGIVGEVVQSGKSIRVDDAYRDPRFDKSVDVASGFTTRNLLCQALRDVEGNLIGAFEVINRTDGPFTDEDEETLAQLGVPAAIALQNAREREQMTRSIEQLTEQVTQGVQIIGESPAIVALRATVVRLAATDLPVLILGESGTGKEVVAQSLHFQGPRAALPFIAVNCAALTETLLESELFGHEKGAFTDAREMRRGKFELAEGGTLFLDEIGDMSQAGQAKLLRVLEQKVITRVGGSQSIPINVRVIAATNANLTGIGAPAKVSGRPLLSAQRRDADASAVAGTAGRRVAVGRVFFETVLRQSAAAVAQVFRRRAAAVAGPLVAGQRPRAAEPDGARRLLGQRRQGRSPRIWRSFSVRVARRRWNPRVTCRWRWRAENFNRSSSAGRSSACRAT